MAYDFLGKRLEDVIETKEVETEGKTIRIIGPLSAVFTQALNEELKKDPNESIPVLESFTDPQVIAHYLVDSIKQQVAKPNPITIYAFNKETLNEETVVEASTALSMAENPDDFYVVYDYNHNPVERVPTDRGAFEYLSNALESIVLRLGGHYVHGARGFSQEYNNG